MSLESRQAADSDQHSISAILKDVFAQVTNLFRGEVALARAEVAGMVRSALGGVGTMAVALVFAITALNVLTLALIALLDQQGVPAGPVALGIGVLFAIIAVVCGRRAMRALSAFDISQSRAVQNVRRDIETIKERIDQ